MGTSVPRSPGTLSPGTDAVAIGVVIAAAGPKDWAAETPENTDPEAKSMIAKSLMPLYGGTYFI
jgi:hypothetical protein